MSDRVPAFPPAGVEPAERPVARRRLFVACLASMVVFAGAVVTPSICLQDIADEFNLSLAGRAALPSVRMAALLVALLLAGYLADRVGKRRLLSAGMLLMGGGLAATALARSYAGLLTAQALAGVGAGALEALVNPLVAELHAKAPARPLNLANGFFSAGLVAGALVAGEALQAGYAWRITLWMWVLPAALGACLYVTPGYPDAAGTSPTGGRTAFLGRRLFWVLMIGMVLGGGCEAGLTTWGANFTERELGGSPRFAAWTVAFYGASMALGRFGSAWLVTRVRPIGMMAGSAILCGLGTAGLYLVQSVYQAWAVFALGGLFVACFWPTILAVAEENVQAGSATMFAGLAAAGITGCVIFPWGIGAVGDVAGLRAGAGLLPASMVAQVLVLAVAWRMVHGTPLEHADRAS